MMQKSVMMSCETRLIVEKQGTTGKIEATVTTWGAREGADGRRFNYQPEGFSTWLKEFESSGRPLPMFVNHSSDAIPVGEWTSFDVTDSGLTAQGRIYTNTSAGADLYKIMQESPMMFGGVSVGAYADEYQMVNETGEVDSTDSAYFQITKGGLREVSVVMYPNNPHAEVSNLEFFRADMSPDLKVFEQSLRDAGLSKVDAVAAASIFKRVIERRDAVQISAEDAPNRRDSDAEATKEQEIIAALEEREFLKLLTNRIKV